MKTSTFEVPEFDDFKIEHSVGADGVNIACQKYYNKGELVVSIEIHYTFSLDKSKPTAPHKFVLTQY